ncbi:acyltransferase [Streptomyces sp. 21So2-11]|uniref:acyltransferase family protein n=1 Tax=Streptomyces sp. 21So2-11 TaxID=3144408 RepID=UPI003218EC10
MSETTGGTGAPRPPGSSLPSLTGMRMVAALAVFFYHAGELSPLPSVAAAGAFKSVFGQGGWFGVSFFFVLSGFVLTWAARPTDTMPRFWRRRLVKVFPNHLVTLVAATVSSVVLGQTLGVWKTVANMFLLQSWDWHVDIWGGINPVSWSLSCELLFYASFPLVLRLVNRIKASRLWLWTLGTTAVIALAPTVATLVVPSGPLTFAPISEGELWFLYAFPPIRMLEFLLGILLARTVQQGRWIPLGLLPATALLLATYILSSHVGFSHGLVAVTALPIGLLIAAAAHADINDGWSPVRGPVAVWIGKISFAFYLWHFLVLQTMDHLWGGAAAVRSVLATTAFTALALVVSLLLSWATFNLVEEPVMRRWGSPRTRGGSTPGTPTPGGPTDPARVGTPIALKG